MLRHLGFVLLWVLSATRSANGGEARQTASPPAFGRVSIPSLHTDNAALDSAFRIAIGDLFGNVAPFHSGLLDKPAPVILAGLNYGRPWTRDASINAWNGASLIMPDVSRNTLVSVLQRTQDGVRIGGQYWDAIVWATGAWHHYLYTGDRAFLALAMEATKNSLRYFEETEFDKAVGLFRGPAWSDGVAAYPDVYAPTGCGSCILDWPKDHPDKAVQPGVGIPMKGLSTNCLYYSAYLTIQKMARELGAPIDHTWAQKATDIKAAINKRLWNPAKQSYRILTCPHGDCDYQEALGHAYALLFGVAEGKRADAVFRNTHVTPAGVPCGWPTFPRYRNEKGTSFGRHSGTVWPQIQGFWAQAAARFGKRDIFAHELFNLAKHANRDKQFAEIYHPLTGAIYGGMQEAGKKGIVLWRATSRQTWAATAYIRMILTGLLGMRFSPDGVRFRPCLPEGVTRVELRGLIYRRMSVDVAIRGKGRAVRSIRIDGQAQADALLSARGQGRKTVAIVLD